MSIVATLTSDEKTWIRERYAYDPSTGIFIFKKNNVIVKIKRRSLGVTFPTHRRGFSASHIAWLLHYGKSPPSRLYHINGDQNDYRISNLQLSVPPTHGVWMKTTKYGNLLNKKCVQVRSKAAERGLDFDLTQEQVEQLLLGNCHYCDVSSKNVKDQKGNSTAGINGIDRLDSSRGYTLDNVVSCCKICNYAKGTLTLKEFRAWVERIHRHMYAKKT